MAELQQKFPEVFEPRYPLPNIHDFSLMSSGCSIFSCIDVVDAYKQISVDPSCSHKLNITTPIGCYRYLYLPMGLATSSNYFCYFHNLAYPGIRETVRLLTNVAVWNGIRKDEAT